MKKFYSFLLATVALLCSTAANAYATTGGWSSVNTAAYDGKCGDNAYWTLDEGALTIFGEGAMYNYAGNDANRAPWYADRENITSVTIEEGVTSIGNFAFDDCYNLTSIEIPSSVTSISDYAFYYCTSLTNIEIPSSVTSIGKSAFYNCISLTSIEIPSSVTSIGESAFEACYGLTSIEIPSSVTSIGNSAFYNCSGLTSIEIPEGVTSIRPNAFSGCYGLTSIVSHIAAENLFAPGDNAFNGIDNDACTLYVPAGAKSTYAATEQWKDFTNIVETYDLTVTAAGYATLYLGTAVEIPAGVEAYTAARIEGDLLKMQAVEDVIPANTAVIIKAEEGNYTFIPSNETPDAIEGNLLRGTLIDTYIKPASAQTAYVLSKVDGIVGMYRAKLKADGTFKNNANRVYMLLGEINVGEGDLDTSNPGGQLSNGYRFDFSGTTAIESVETESAAPAVYYDLSGRRVENPAKGIYIVNGKKVLVK
ncbi:MAG: leucine-rich repeat domain-containing protein [Bacteroidaceae bacterium]|nr:leucine-rich repeat domain-containing protein [Bacteroidaceae bacterium]